MKNRKCPSHKVCLDYDNGNCENCVFGETIIKLHKRIDRLKKQNETLTIQRNAWYLSAKAVAEDVNRLRAEGEWLPQFEGSRLVKCSVCGYEYCDLIECSNYCGNCGAKMKGD